MPQIINTNIPSLNSQRHLNTSQSALATSLERLASGKRINSAKDDAAGLGISSRMTSQINGMNQAIRNARDGISLAQTAEGSLSKSADMLQRIRTLAVQSSNAPNAAQDRQSLQQEVNDLLSELDRFAITTSFNGKKLMDGSMGTANFQVGANAGELIGFAGSNFRTHVYGTFQSLNDGVIGEEGTAARATLVADVIDIDNGVTASTLAISGLGQAEAVITAGMSAAQVADTINLHTEATGVTAKASTSALLTVSAIDADDDDAVYTMGIVSNNTTNYSTINFRVSSDDATGYEAAIREINAQSGSTGVTAAWDAAAGGIKLTNASGADISIVNLNDASGGYTGNLVVDAYNADGTAAGTAATATAPADLTADATVVKMVGTVTLNSPNGYNIAFASGTGLTKINLDAATLQAVNTIDISTFAGAQRAIDIASAGIDALNREMANYGALQNRLQYTIENLEISSENTANARSRIEDADFAQETANLSRATILQQAGIAMLAQANQMPQNVLSLIR